MSNEKQILLPVRDGEKTIYDIRIDKSFDSLAEAVNSIENKGKRILIVSDSNVFPLYGEEVTGILSKCFDTVVSYVIPAGEENKTLNQVRNIYEALIKSGLDRHDMIAALGGGVTGDMAGFTAATYLRGIRCAVSALSRSPRRCFHRSTPASAERPAWILTATRIWSALFISLPWSIPM